MARFELEVSCKKDALCIFDTAALPSDFDARLGQNPLLLQDALQEEGRFWYDDTTSSGDYVCHVYVDEPLELDAKTRSRILTWSQPSLIECPSGDLWVCGTQYAANEPRKGSDVTPKGGLRNFKMGKRLKVKQGLHSLCVIRIDKDEREFGLFSHANWVDAAYVPLGLLAAGAGTLSIVLTFQVILGAAGALIEWITGRDLCECAPARFSLLEQFGILVGCIAVTTIVFAAISAFGRTKAVRLRYQTEKKRRLAKPDYIFDIKTAKYLGVDKASLSEPRSDARIAQDVHYAL